MTHLPQGRESLRKTPRQILKTSMTVDDLGSWRLHWLPSRCRCSKECGVTSRVAQGCAGRESGQGKRSGELGKAYEGDATTPTVSPPGSSRSRGFLYLVGSSACSISLMGNHRLRTSPIWWIPHRSGSGILAISPNGPLAELLKTRGLEMDGPP